MIKSAGQSGRIRKRILYQDESRNRQRESSVVAGDQTRNFINCVWGCTGSSNYCILHHQRAIGRARTRGRAIIFVFGAARRAFHLLFTSCTKRIFSLPPPYPAARWLWHLSHFLKEITFLQWLPYVGIIIFRRKNGTPRTRWFGIKMRVRLSVCALVPINLSIPLGCR